MSENNTNQNQDNELSSQEIEIKDLLIDIIKNFEEISSKLHQLYAFSEIKDQKKF